MCSKLWTFIGLKLFWNPTKWSMLLKFSFENFFQLSTSGRTRIKPFSNELLFQNIGSVAKNAKQFAFSNQLSVEIRKSAWFYDMPWKSAPRNKYFPTKVFSQNLFPIRIGRRQTQLLPQQSVKTFLFSPPIFQVRGPQKKKCLFPNALYYKPINP